MMSRLLSALMILSNLTAMETKMTNEEKDKLEAQIRQLTTERNALRQEVIYYTSSSRIGQVAALRADLEKMTSERDRLTAERDAWISKWAERDAEVKLAMAEAQRLRGEVEHWTAETTHATRLWSAEVTENTRLRAALERYGQHEDECNLTIKMIDHELPHVGLICNCGLSEALAGGSS